MIAPTISRVSQNTSQRINDDIRRRTEETIAYYANADVDAVERRLAELDREWDIERCLETMAPAITLFGLCMSVVHSRKWLILPAFVQSFFLQHAIQGWCPPIPVLRRLGIRTMEEIDRERYALKALRGDFDGLRGSDSATSKDRAADALRAATD